MDAFPIRFALLIRFVAFLALVYLFLDLAASKAFRQTDSKVRGFFALVASPITRPIRSLLPPGASEDRVRWAAIGALALVWAASALVVRLLLSRD